MMSTPSNKSGPGYFARQRGEGDVVDGHQPLLSATDPSYRTPAPTRSNRLRDIFVTYPSGKRSSRIRLPPTPPVCPTSDPFDELELSTYTSSSKHRRRRRFIIGWAVAIWLLGVVAYVVDVDRSWKALEDKWEMGQNDDVDLTSDGDASMSNTTMIWGHSHNDEMQGKDAFNLALGLGYGSIEADTWLIDQNGVKSLMVGHVPVDLRHTRTLSTVYLQPILQILDDHNKDRKSGDPWIGLLEDDPTAEVQLVIDFKSDGATMWPYVLKALQPLLEAGYLTTYNTTSESWTRGPLTIIGTGNTPLSHVYYSSTRIIFYDGPLRRLQKLAKIPQSIYGPSTKIQLDATICPMASAKLPPWAHVGLAFRPSPNAVVAWMKRRTREARIRGIKSRWWGAANQPVWLRRRMWALMKEAETDWTNADDLRDLAKWLRRTNGSWEPV